jgi:hypothetical protein
VLTETTIGRKFNFFHATLEQIVEQISDEEFDLMFLSRNPNLTELKDCCVLAVERMAGEPFAGRKTCADVMGRAMELLRYLHKLNAPRGWVPVIRALRSNPGSVRRDAARIGFESIGAPPAEEVLTHPASALCGIDNFDCGGALQAYAEQHPELVDLFIQTAKRLGVPGCWLEGLVYVNAVIAELGAAPGALVMVREKLQARCAAESELEVT